MNSNDDLARTVLAAAELLALPIAADDRQDVVNAFGILARAASFLRGHPLPDDLLAAAQFRPLEGAE